MTDAGGLRIFTWHVHGNYLYYLSHIPHEIIIPVSPRNETGYGGRGDSFPFGLNVREVPAEQVRDEDFDCILFQSKRNYLIDQYEILSETQRRLPRVYLEHDPPREHPTDTQHIVDEPDVLVVHVTHFNALMWDSGRSPVQVIEHGVVVPDGVRYTGEIEAGLVVVNNLAARGRRLGLDVFMDLRERIPLELVGMGSKEVGGLGEIPPTELPSFAARYRFMFNPIRWTSLGLAVCEAMTIGMPVAGLATAEMATVIDNGQTGFIDTNPARLEEHARWLLEDPAGARAMGERGRQAAVARFNIHRFVDDWDRTLRIATGTSRAKLLGVSR